MDVTFSPFLREKKAKLQELICRLSPDFPYVSILGSDVYGTAYQVRKSGSTVTDSRWAERGFICRIYNGKGYSEYSFDNLDNRDALEEKIRETAATGLFTAEKVRPVEYPIITEEPTVQKFHGTIQKDPEELSPKEIIEILENFVKEGLSRADFLLDVRVCFEHVKTSKLFLSPQKDLEQSYLCSQGYSVAIGKGTKGIRYGYRSASGMKGAELLDEIHTNIPFAVEEAKELLNAERLIPGEYDIICDPAMSGLIAHEAFGHGVEMDMFVKNRAKAAEYMNKTVASPKVRMHDGASAARQVSSYLFDDEGTLGSDTMIIEEGVLKRGISDQLSALKLGTIPTGNGKRESFERKAYSRMTNTFFKPGTDSLSEMIRSIDRGYLLEGFSSGMEDPKNWGIQCVSVLGREIQNGKLTGKVIAPVYLTGYVPDLLQAIDMVSPDFKLSGSGACGKGHKEYVKTSTGGPYIKTRGRLA
ncbi:MAG: TldD/PmbA family protein [Spirochaetales bacterium]|nr:TldD/PmbA family protein [Spirochaetales bacterium]